MSEAIIEKPKHNKKLIILAIVILFITALIPTFRNFQKKATESEVKTMAGAFQLSQNTFHSESKTYSADMKDIGFSPEGELGTILHTSIKTTESLPEKFKAEIKKIGQPEFLKDSYRLYIEFKPRNMRLHQLWVVTNLTPAQKIAEEEM